VLSLRPAISTVIGEDVVLFTLSEPGAFREVKEKSATDIGISP
jgi:hypothetical protein